MLLQVLKSCSESGYSSTPLPDPKSFFKHVMYTPSLHIAILDCDTPVPKVLSKLGKYSDIFSKLLQDAVHTTKELPQGLQLRFSVFDSVMGGYPSEEELRDIDGIIITGSCEILAFPWRFKRIRGYMCSFFLLE